MGRVELISTRAPLTSSHRTGELFVLTSAAQLRERAWSCFFAWEIVARRGAATRQVRGYLFYLGSVSRLT